MPKQVPHPAFESWGRYPKLGANVIPLEWASEFPLSPPPATRMLAVGAGRSYGDVCLLDHGALLTTRDHNLTRGLDHLLDFDPASGVLCCESGVTIGEVLEFAAPRGFFLPVTPGTGTITLGGAIANDIHGTNHRTAGTFGRHVLRLELVRSDGSALVCSPVQNADLYAATIGGLGLTGLITWAEIKLRRIASPLIRATSNRFSGIGAFLTLTEAKASFEYVMARLDCQATGRNFARGVFSAADHDAAPERHRSRHCWTLPLPFDVPGALLDRRVVGIVNALYCHRARSHPKVRTMDYRRFFHAVDRVPRSNRIYGKSGQLRFECVLPRESVEMALTEILKATTRSDLGLFPAELRIFGDLASPGLLSFPKPGIAFALSIPFRPETSLDLAERLTGIALASGGRIYSAADAVMTADQFQSSYPRWKKFAALMDPAFSSAFWQRVTA